MGLGFDSCCSTDPTSTMVDFLTEDVIMLLIYISHI